MTFWTYLLHCRGGVFYAGHSDDLERRIADHKSGLVKGFTQNLLPAELVWSQEFPTRYEALMAERQIKGWSRAKKLALIRGDWDEISRLAKSKSDPSTGSGRTAFELASGLEAELIQEAARAHPQECCGLLLGQGGRITQTRRAANVHTDPAIQFEIDPAVLLAAHRGARGGGLQVLGYYHSHPNGRAQPSPRDQAGGAGDGRVWAIVARGAVTWWRDLPGGFEPLPMPIAPG